MTIEIDQDILCDYCKRYHDSDMRDCGGSRCEDMQKDYLDDHGISEDNPEVKTFKKLRVGDKIYQLLDNQLVPAIKMREVNGLSQMNDNPLRIHYESTGFNIADDKVCSDNSKGYFIYKKDCEKELTRLCMNRILALSKAIGSIGSSDLEK